MHLLNFWTRTPAPTRKPIHYRSHGDGRTFCGLMAIRAPYEVPGVTTERVPASRLTTDIDLLTCPACRTAIRKAVS